VFGRIAKKTETPKAARLYRAGVERARDPVFFTQLGVSDSVDGRFDCLALHAVLILEALEQAGAQARPLAEDFTTALFVGLEEALREMGVSDFGLSRRMKKMANAFYGRLQAYRAAMTEEALVAVLERNLYRGAVVRPAEALAVARYIMRVRAHFANETSRVALLAGSADFESVPILRV
jgi:cytochrome b pre-mRNA-processing protein 3